MVDRSSAGIFKTSIPATSIFAHGISTYKKGSLTTVAPILQFL